jgi:hypothetical protein
MRFSLFTFFSVSRHMPGPKVCVSHYSRFSVFLAIFQVLQCAFFIFHIFQGFFFLPYSRSNNVCFSFFFNVFHVSLHILGPRVCIAQFSRFSVFLSIIQVIQCLCLIFYVFQFCRHNPGPTVCISHFSHFSVLL